MSGIQPGDRIDIGTGRFGIVTEVSVTGLLRVSWDGGGRGIIAPDHRARVDRGYFAQLVADAEAVGAKARSDAAKRGWDTRRAAAIERGHGSRERVASMP